EGLVGNRVLGQGRSGLLHEMLSQSFWYRVNDFSDDVGSGDVVLFGVENVHGTAIGPGRSDVAGDLVTAQRVVFDGSGGLPYRVYDEHVAGPGQPGGAGEKDQYFRHCLV